jgi:hypothetical protein
MRSNPLLLVPLFVIAAWPAGAQNICTEIDPWVSCPPNSTCPYALYNGYTRGSVCLGGLNMTNPGETARILIRGQS